MKDWHFVSMKHEPQPSTREAFTRGRSFLLGFSKLKRQKSNDTCNSFNDGQHHEINPEASKTTSLPLQPGLQHFSKLKKLRRLEPTELKGSRWSSPRTRTSRPHKESFIDRLFSGNSLASKLPSEHLTYIQTLRKLRDRERRTLSQVVSLNLMLAKLQQRKRPAGAVQELGWYDGRGMKITYVKSAPKIIATNPYAITSPAHKPKTLLATYFGMVTTPDIIIAPPIQNPSRWRRPYAQTAVVVTIDDITCSLVVSAVAPKSFSPPNSYHSTSSQTSQSSSPTISEKILPSDLSIPATFDTKDQKANMPLTMLKGDWGWREQTSVSTDMNTNINFTDLNPMGRCLPMEDVVMSNSMVVV